jgi:hypothetical protein
MPANYIDREHNLAKACCPAIKRNVPATESGDNFFLRDGVLFSKDHWIGFHKDFRTLVFQRDVDLVFTDNWTLDGLTQEYGLVFLRTLDLLWFFFGSGYFGFSSDFRNWFFFGFLEMVFLSDVGYFNIFSFDNIKIEILFTFYTFLRFLFAHLPDKLICI